MVRARTIATLKSAGRRGWRFWLGVALSVLSLLWLAVTTDWVESWQALKQTNYSLLLAAIGLNLLSIPIRTVRWRTLFPGEKRSTFGRMTGLLLLGQALNLLSPARLGDLAQAALVGTASGAFVIGVQAMRLLLDLLMIGIMIVLLLFQLTLPDWWRAPGQVLLVITALALLTMIILVAGRSKIQRFLVWLSERFSHRVWQRAVNLAAEFVDALKSFSRPGVLIGTVLLTVIIWMFYVSVNNVLLGAVGESYSWLASTFLLVVLTLGSAIPSSPGRVGVYHYLGVQALAVFGVDQAVSVTYTILLHIITVVIPVILAFTLVWLLGIRFPAREVERHD